MSADVDLWAVPLAVFAGAIRAGSPFLFVSLGECLTERGGRINLGLEGALVMGAMSAYGGAVLSGSPWLGLLAALVTGGLLGLLHGLICSLPRVNDIAVGIGLMLLGIGLAFFFGKPFIQPRAPGLPAFELGAWSSDPLVREALRINVLFPLGLAACALMHLALTRTRWGLALRCVGDSQDTARALGLPILRLRLTATALGGALAGIGGASLSLFYPGSWNEGLSSGQGLMAVALVVFARWQPWRCLYAALLFGGAGALGPALQAAGVTGAYHLFNAAPYVLTLALMACASERTGAPGELRLSR